jgi:ubiquinone/menaquinone biosynthesis C-methylase UbiE
MVNMVLRDRLCRKMRMAEQQIRFDDAAAYEQMMGTWSRFAGEMFLDWVAPASGLRWIDIGCGSGAFTELIVQRCAPAEVQGVDPSAAQLAFARARHKGGVAHFREGHAGALPFPDDRFHSAVMALVLFFVPDPAQGVREMVRVVRAGGTVAAYAWDMLGGGFPLESVQAEMRALGVATLHPPSAEASRIEAMEKLWRDAGLEAVQTRQIGVQRTFDNFEQFWTISLLGSSIRQTVAAMPAEKLELLKARVRVRSPADAAGRIVCAARANAIKGRVII